MYIFGDVNFLLFIVEFSFKGFLGIGRVRGWRVGLG